MPVKAYQSYFALGFSRYLACYFLSALFLSLSVLYALPSLGIARYAIMIGIVLLAVRHWRLYVQRSAPQSVIAVWQNLKGDWGFSTHDGLVWLASIQGDSFVHPWCIVLHARSATRSVYVSIPRDSLEAFAFQLLSLRMAQIKSPSRTLSA